MGAHSRRKGATAEREVVAIAKAAGFDNAERAAPMQCATGDERHPDVANVGRLFVEVKRRGKGSMYALAVEATKERAGYVPTLAYREDGGPWLAVVPLAELLKLERAALHPTLTHVCRADHLAAEVEP
jgi:Holliday junction resolvase